MTEEVEVRSLPCVYCGKPVFYEFRGWTGTAICCDQCAAERNARENLDHDPSDPPNYIPPRFAASLSDEELYEICETGRLNRTLCERLYRMTDRHDEPPESITPYVNRASVDRLLKSKRKNKRKNKPRIKGRP